MRQFLDALLPRFVTDRVAVTNTGPDEYETICLEEELEDGEKFDAILQFKYLGFLGFALFVVTTLERKDDRPF